MNRLALACLFFLSACGPDRTPAEWVLSGEQALGAGNDGAALTRFETALAGLDSQGDRPMYVRAKLGAAEARATSDAAEASQEFLELARNSPTDVTDRDYYRIGAALGDAGALEQAAEVLTAALEAYPDSGHLLSLRERLGSKAEADEDSDALRDLQSMGYMGGD